MSKRTDDGLEIGDETWWAEAEKKALRDVRQERQRRRLRRLRGFIPAAVAVVALVAIGGGYVHSGHADGLIEQIRGGSNADNAAGYGVLAPKPVDLTDPYFETEAAAFGVGEAGFVIPAAKPMGKHSAAIVAERMANAKRLLVLSRLDPRVVSQRYAQPFIAQFAPDAQARVRQTVEGTDGALALITRLAPGQSLLAPPRVSGALTPGIGSRGELTVAAKYVVIYALKPTGPAFSRSSTHVALRAEIVLAFYGKEVGERSQGIWLETMASYASNVSCDESSKGLLALPTMDESVGGDPTTPDQSDRFYRNDGPAPDQFDCP